MAATMLPDEPTRNQIPMSLPPLLQGRLTLPVIGAPMFTVSYPELVIAQCTAGIVGAFPADSHPAIVYPVAATTTAKPQAAGYLAFLRSTAARSIFEKYGFKYLVSPTA